MKQNKEKILSFRLSKEDYNLVAKESKKLGMKKSEYILSKLFPIKKINRPYPFQKL